MIKEIQNTYQIAPQASNKQSEPSSVKENVYFGRSIKKNIITPYGKKIRLAAIAESERIPGLRANSPDLALGSLIRGMQQSRARVISFALQDAIKFSNQVTYNYISSKQRNLLPSTLTVALLDKNQLHIATVGESEVFLLKNGHFKWLQTKSSISAVERKRLIGTGPNVTPRNLSLSASTALDTGFNGIKLNRQDKVMLCSSKLIGKLIETNPNYFDEIKRFIQEINPSNYATALGDWVEKLDLSAEFSSMPPLLVLFPEGSEASNEIGSDASQQKGEDRSNSGSAAPNREGEADQPEAIKIQKRGSQAETERSGFSNFETRAVQAVEIDNNTGYENGAKPEEHKMFSQNGDRSPIGTRNRELDRLNRSNLDKKETNTPSNNSGGSADRLNGTKPVALNSTQNMAEVNHFSPESPILYDNIEMTRQSPVQTALAAFPLMIDTIGEAENQEISPPNPRLTSIQIFFSILIVITLTILISVIFSVIWSEFS